MTSSYSDSGPTKPYKPIEIVGAVGFSLGDKVLVRGNKIYIVSNITNTTEDEITITLKRHIPIAGSLI